MKKLLVLSFALVAWSFTCYSQGYKISVKINDVADTTAMLGYYYGKYQYVTDTIRLDHTGRGVFESKDTVGGGIYFIVLPNQKFFEFILDKDRNLYFEADTADLVKSVKAKGSEENTLFFGYKMFINDRGIEIDRLAKELTLLKKSDNKDSIDIVEKRMKEINDEVSDYKLKFMKDHPKSFVTKVFYTSREPEIPEAPVLLNGRKDSTFAYRYYRAHFWDNYDFADDRLLRTPVYHAKLDQYLNKTVPQIPDTLMKEVDMIFARASANKEVYKYTVWYLTHFYETSQVMGMDAVFCHIVDSVYIPKKAFWVSEKTNKNIIDHCEKLRPNLIGKTAPELILLDTNNRLVSLHSVPASYTILFFWDPACGHCKTETPLLVEYYNRVKDSLNMRVYAVCTDTSLVTWKKTIAERKMEPFINVNGTRTAQGNFHDLYDVFSTPVVYILDKKKRIIGKKIPVDQIDSFMKFQLKHPLFSD